MKVKAIAVLGSALVASGCLDASDCDPNAVGNVLTSAMCNDAFGQRIDNLGRNEGTLLAEIERERIAVSRATTRVRELQAQQRLSASQAADINRQIDALNRDINRLSQTSNPQQADALRVQIERRKDAINAFANVAVI